MNEHSYSRCDGCEYSSGDACTSTPGKRTRRHADAFKCYMFKAKGVPTPAANCGNCEHWQSMSEKPDGSIWGMCLDDKGHLRRDTLDRNTCGEWAPKLTQENTDGDQG